MYPSYYQDHLLFDDLDFENAFFSEATDLNDCYLSQTELDQFSSPSSEKWQDFLSNENEAVITMDSARETQWKQAKEEFEHVMKTLKELLSVEDPNTPTLEQIVDFFLGPHSKIGNFLREELELDEKSYLEFLSTYCIQAAYRASFTQLFHEKSLLKDHIRMTEDDYIQVWRTMAQKKRMSAIDMTRTGRREEPL